MSVKKCLLPSVAALLVAPFLLTPLWAESSNDPVKKFQKEMKDADAGTRIRLIQDLAKSGDEHAGKAIAPYMMSRDKNVRAAAILAAGTMKDKRLFWYLDRFLKTSHDGDVLIPTLNAIAEYKPDEIVRIKKDIMGVARRWLPKDSKVLAAAAGALGKIPSRKTVDDLIKLLKDTAPSVGGRNSHSSSPNYSQKTYATFRKDRPGIIAALKDLTGWDFGDARAWENFWKTESRGWSPEQKKHMDLSKARVYMDPGYNFRIRKPAKRWVMSHSPTARIQMSASLKGLETSRIWVVAYDLKNYQSLTAEQKTTQELANVKGSWKDVKESTIVRKPVRIGRETGETLSFAGIDPNGNVLVSKYVCVVHDGFMYVIGSWIRSGAPSKLDKERLKAIDSFRFTSR